MKRNITHWLFAHKQYERVKRQQVALHNFFRKRWDNFTQKEIEDFQERYEKLSRFKQELFEICFPHECLSVDDRALTPQGRG